MRIQISLLLCALPALASPLTVQNASFETATLPLSFPQGTLSNLVPGTSPTGGTLANWTPINTTPGNWIGAYNPTPGGNNWSFVWESGNNVGYAQSLGVGATNAGLSQVLGDVLTANTTYTLLVDVGRRSFTLPVWNYSVELWAGSTQVGSAFSHPGMAGNTVNLESLIVNIGASHAALGQQLEVRLMTNGNTTEAFFDNVRLDANTVPEPGTYATVAAGLLLAGFWRRRSQQRP